MKLARIRIEQLRRFGKPFELCDLTHGLNLFHGPNEAGKSTVVRAIRAAFFERYRTENVQDLVPHDDAAAAPTVELDFSIGGEAYALRKVWLKKKRCELSVAGRRLDGEEAEAHLAQLLGFGIRDKGASRAELWGIPGLLWIEQGAGHEIGEAIEYAADHLRSALKSTAAEVASTQGDAVIARVKKLREELVTKAKGAPRGEFAKVVEERTRLAAECARLDQAASDYGSQVDELATLTTMHAAEQAAKPWEAMRRQQAARARQAARDRAARSRVAHAGRSRQAHRRADRNAEREPGRVEEKQKHCTRAGGYGRSKRSSAGRGGGQHAVGAARARCASAVGSSPVVVDHRRDTGLAHHAAAAVRGRAARDQRADNEFERGGDEAAVVAGRAGCAGRVEPAAPTRCRR